MREAEEVEGFGAFVAATLPVLRREAAELERSRLLGVQFQSELLETLAELGVERLCIRTMLKPGDEVVGVANDDHLAARPLLPPLLGPEVEDVMKVEIGEERANAAALHRPQFAYDPLPVFQHTGLQPFLDEV